MRPSRTTTAPTGGFGLTCPRIAQASSSARAIGSACLSPLMVSLSTHEQAHPCLLRQAQDGRIAVRALSLVIVGPAILASNQLHLPAEEQLLLGDLVLGLVPDPALGRLGLTGVLVRGR